MSNLTNRAAVMTVVALCIALGAAATAANAGTVLLSRDSTISATAGDAVNISDGSQSFDGFSDVVDNATAGVDGMPHLTANQNSRPALDDAAGFTGAFAEGSASSDGSGATDPAKAEAISNFDLTFQVLNVPSLVSFGGSVGVSGSGSTTVELCNDSTGEVLLSKAITGEDGQSIDHSALLDPGVYSLSVAAAVDGKSDDGTAYFAVNLSIAPAESNGGGPTPIPLPPAVWGAASVLGAGGVVRFLRGRGRCEM